MRLTLDRKWPRETYTIGKLYVNGELFCNTLEDRDRGLHQTDSLEQIRSLKIPGETAIPKGMYTVAMNVLSPKYAGVAWYKSLCGGKMPRLLDVPGFDGILIHPGTDALSTRGCLLVGNNTIVGKLTESKATFQKLYKRMKAASDRGETITIEIL